ncbi:MAG: SsrA-binding protein SmpB [bacterium]|nr:SsrA-binding protein SmpB [bacterium]
MLLENKKARFNYEITETVEAGMELVGQEVKSLREKHGVLEGSHVVIRGGEAFLVGATIPPYQPKNAPDYDPERNRRLLLTKKEIAKLSEVEKIRGLTIVPLKVYNKKNKIKIAIGIARGKKKYDKREDMKRRDTEREIARDIKVR